MEIRKSSSSIQHYFRKALLLFSLFFLSSLHAQNLISVPFANGFVGNEDGNNKSINSYYLNGLGWSNIQFTQNSSTNQFQEISTAQGNDIVGNILITDNNGIERSINGYIKWRAPSGTVTTMVFVPATGTNISLATNGTNGSGTYVITDLKYIGLTFNGQTLSISPIPGTVTGNAATNGLLQELNTYLGLLPKISIQDKSANENSGSTTVTVSLSASSSNTVSVNYATVNGTALAGSDYTTASGTITFAPGETTKTIPITILDDNIVDSAESFSIVLSDPTNAAILYGTSSVSIVDNELPADPAQSLISANPTSILANGITTSSITVQLKNSSNVNLTGSGGTVLVTTTAGTLSTVTDNSDGTYTVTLTSSSTAGSATLGFSINGTTATATATVAFTAPTITSSVSSLSAFTSCQGSASTSQSFTVSGTDLTSNVTITAPTGYEVSLTSGSGYAPSITLTPASGSLSATTVYVRMATSASGNPSGNITVVSGSASQNVAVTGTVTSLPTLEFKLSPPDVSTSAIQGQVGTRTENFNSFTDGNVASSGTYAVGTYTKTGSAATSQYLTNIYYGAPLPNSTTLSTYLGVFSGGVVNVTLTDPSKYLGFWWAGGDDRNQVTIFGTCNGVEVQLAQFTTSTVTSLLSSPTITAIDGNVYNSSAYIRNAPFAYINLQLNDPNITFSRLEFTQNSGGGGFEIDNITTGTGYGAASFTTPGAPTITSVTRGTGTATINFTAPASDGGQAITNYQYSIDGGTNWLTLSPADTTTPLVISGLNDATAYPIIIRAVNSIGGGIQSNSVNAAATCTPPQVAAITSQTVCNGAPTSVINFSPVNTAGYQWMTLNSITSSAATGTGQNGITVSITQSGGGLGSSAIYGRSTFPATYSVPSSGYQIQNTKDGVFTATFSTPVTNPIVAFASVGNPSTSVPVIVSAPFTPIFSTATTYDLPNNTFTGTEGYNIIRIDGTVSTVSFNYTVAEVYANMAFGFEDQNTTYNWTNDTPSIGLAASGTGNILPFNGINTGTTPVVATITVTPVTGGCAGTPRTFTITVNPSTTISYSSSSFEIEAGQAITPITPTTNGTSFAISPALPTGLSLNTSTGVISGTPTQAVISGTYTITATLASTGCTATTTLLLSDPSCSPFAAADFQTNGNATLSGNIYTLTPNQGGRNGSAWNKNRLFLDQDFDINARVYLGNDDAGADGIAFVLQNQSLNAGSSGGGLGYAGISPSFAVEFDTYNNGNIEPNQDHIAIIANGNTAGAHNTYSTPFGVQMEDGQWHTARFVWDASTKNFQVWYDGTRRHDITIDLKADIFNGRPYVYWGFTGATGGATNLQQVEFTTYCYAQQVGVTALPGTNNANASLAICEGATVSLQASASTSYQWFKDGVAISGQTGRELIVATAGAYTVEAITNQNTTLSEVVTVSVTQLPAFAYSASYSFERTKAVTSVSPTSTGGTVGTYAISPVLPSGLTFNTSTGLISGTPTAVSASQTYTVTGTTATASCVGTTTFTLEVFNAVAPSSLSYSPATQTVRQSTSIEVMTPTISGGAPTYSISPALPAGLTINATTGVISGTLTATQTGSVTYTVTATNTGGSTTATVTLVYNTAPTNISLSTSSINENNAVNEVVGTLSSSDADTGDTHTYTLVSGEGSTDNESFTIAQNQLKATPVFDFETKTSYSVRIKTTDAGGLTYEKGFTITINNVDESPILSVSQSSFYGVVNVTLPTIVVSNSGGAANSFAITPTLPAGLSFNTATGSITGTPTVLLTSRDFTISGTNSDGTGSVTFALFIDLDTDGDGIGNQNDADMDGDGVSNTQEAIDGTNSLNSDTDGDGVIDGTEKTDGTDPKNGCKFVVANRTVTPSSAWNAADCDGDGLSNGTEGVVDTDRDGTPDYLDLDADGDGILDKNDALPLNQSEWTDTDRDGTGDNADTDDDNDGILDSCDVDTNGDKIPDNGTDMDADGINDGCDTDKDGDGVNNTSDNCPNSPNTDQADRDRDGKGDICDTVEINVSQAITPNGDGINDTWVIYNLSYYPGSIVRVFNRWGKEVFYSADYQNNWTGHYKDNSEKLPTSGSYYYQIDLGGDGSIDVQGWLYITQ